jgi:hypothetical protein
MCVKQARSCNQRCSEKAIPIAYYKCVFVALGIQHENRKRPVAWLALNVFLRYLINSTVFKKSY